MRRFSPKINSTIQIILILVLNFLTSEVIAQDADFIRNNYDKYEYQIAMRDGIKLFTSVYVPKDKSKTYPILLKRTPYSIRPYGEDQYIRFPDNVRKLYFKDGYIMVYQDVRGRYMSEGSFVNVRPYIKNKKSNKDIDETTDTYDTVDWLVKNIPNNNGRVGVSGISYPGFYSSMAAIDAHPAIKAVSPQAPVSKWMAGDDFFHNGAFLISHAFNFYSAFGQPRPQPKKEPDIRFKHGTKDGYKFFLELGALPNAETKYMKGKVAFWQQIMKHGQWDDFWAERNILQHLRDIKPAMLVVGGWYDTENLFGALHTYAAIENNNPNTDNRLVMGPWFHGQWAGNDGQSLGAVNFGSKTSEYYIDQIEVPFFSYHLKGQGKLDIAEATMFETGRNRWHSLDSWPPKTGEQKKLFLQSGGGLSFDSQDKTTSEYDEYISDPNNPVPYTAKVSNWYDRSFMVEDQRFADRRPDVLVYQTEILTEDITIAGKITNALYVSTSGTDSDWIVKLIDVFPDTMRNWKYNRNLVQLGGYEMLVRGDVLRGKFRNSLAKPEPFTPNKTTKIQFNLEDVFHTFKKGHRIMVQIQSSWFPFIDRNPQKFVNIYEAKEGDFQKATQRVYRSPEYASHLLVTVLK